MPPPQKTIIVFNLVLEPLERKLFSEVSKGFERELHTQEENDKLNASIKTFLSLVSPYLLTQAAQKAIEWLVRRFKVSLCLLLHKIFGSLTKIQVLLMQYVFDLYIFKHQRFINTM